MSFRLIDSVWLFLEEDCYRSKIVLSSVLTIIQPTKIYELLYDLIGSAISNLSVNSKVVRCCKPSFEAFVEADMQVIPSPS